MRLAGDPSTGPGSGSPWRLAAADGGQDRDGQQYAQDGGGRVRDRVQGVEAGRGGLRG